MVRLFVVVCFECIGVPLARAIRDPLKLKEVLITYVQAAAAAQDQLALLGLRKDLKQS